MNCLIPPAIHREGGKLMHYSKPMIDLVLEIRRRVRSQSKPGIKLANPDLLSELIEIYADSRDTVLRTLIKELLTLADGDWLHHLEAPVGETPKTTVKVYRGQVSLEEKESSPEPGSKSEASKTPRYYRGVKIA